jgi:hypothetical protein
MSSYKTFDFNRSPELFNALHALKVNLPTYCGQTPKVEHLKPLVSASSRSNNRIGRLMVADLEKMKNSGVCQHSKLLVLPREPAKGSSATTCWIDSFLQSVSNGSLNKSNTAIFNCRALISNASFHDGYSLPIEPIGMHGGRQLPHYVGCSC